METPTATTPAPKQTRAISMGRPDDGCNSHRLRPAVAVRLSPVKIPGEDPIHHRRIMNPLIDQRCQQPFRYPKALPDAGPSTELGKQTA
jgi:hypothetical protein